MKTVSLILFILMTTPPCLVGQSLAHNEGLSFSGTLGLFPSSLHTIYEFKEQFPVTSEVKTSLFGSIGISYSGIQFIGETELTVSVELYYGRTATPRKRLGSTLGLTMQDDQWFLGTWTKIKVPSIVSPFLRLGVGVFKYHLNEHWSPDGSFPDFNESGGRFALGGGAGIDWNLTETITLSCFGDGVFTPTRPLFSFSVLGVRASVAI